jgi:hypothetical protein
VHGRIRLEDLDGDGVVEIIQNLDSFHYYNGLSYVQSPRVDAVFAYDRKTRRFLPAHDRFPALWQDTLKEARRKQKTRPVIPDILSAQDFEVLCKIRTMESEAVEKAVALIFAGYEHEAYTWLKRQFVVPRDAKRVSETLREHLASDRYYQYLKEHKLKKRQRNALKPQGTQDASTLCADECSNTMC